MTELIEDQMLEDQMAKDKMGEDKMAIYPHKHGGGQKQ